MRIINQNFIFLKFFSAGPKAPCQGGEVPVAAMQAIGSNGGS
jgi:hypothetical protein